MEGLLGSARRTIRRALPPFSHQTVTSFGIQGLRRPGRFASGAAAALALSFGLLPTATPNPWTSSSSLDLFHSLPYASPWEASAPFQVRLYRTGGPSFKN